MAATTPPGLVGRSAEQARLAALLDAARGGTSRVLVLEGEPGIGKTSLLNWTVDRASDFVVLQMRGLESEVALPFGALGQLLRPLEAGLNALPAAQADALGWAVGGRGAAPTAGQPFAPDRFAVGAALLGLLAHVAESQPILVVVDDAHWLDEASVDALAFMARRLLREGIVLLLSTRPDEGSPALRTLPLLLVRGLSPAGAAQLLQHAGMRELDAQWLDHLVAASNGNPLALLELPRLLTTEELAGLVPSHQPLPISHALVDAYSAKWSQLSEGCRQAAATVALLAQADLASAVRALGEAQLSMGALEEAEDAGIVDVTSAGVVFRHPLARSAAAYSVPPSWRRRAHAAVGRSLASASTLNERIEGIWHLAAAANALNEETAAMLEQAGEQAAERAGWGSAAPAFEQAARLSPAEKDRYRRFVLAANAAYHAGMLTKAMHLLGQADQNTPDTPASALLCARTRVRVYISLGWLSQAASVATDTADRYGTSHPVEVAPIVAEGGVASIYQGDAVAAQRGLQRAVDLAEGDEELQLLHRTALGYVLTLRGDFVGGLALLQPMIQLVSEVASEGPSFARDYLLADPHNLQSGAWFTRILSELGELSIATDLAAVVLRRANEAGVLAVVTVVLTSQAFIAFKRADRKTATTTIARSLNLAQEMGLKVEKAQALSVSALVEANFGNEHACRDNVREGLQAAAESGAEYNAPLLHLALGSLELGLRNIDAAVSELEACRDACLRGGLLDLAHWNWAPSLVEAYVARGDTAEARPLLVSLEAQAVSSGRPILHAYACRCRGLLDERFAPAFDEALRWHDQVDDAFELARTQLAYGARLRRQKQRASARTQLQAAFEKFHAFGAHVWADVARKELAATGMRVDEPADGTTTAVLTAQEYQVAAGVAAGATNREVASQLFLSHKTIEYHLGRVFRKLGVSTRKELQVALADLPTPLAERDVPVHRERC